MSQPSDQNMNPAKSEYVAPTITVMDDEQMLKVFQVTSAGSNWWVSMNQGAGSAM